MNSIILKREISYYRDVLSSWFISDYKYEEKRFKKWIGRKPDFEKFPKFADKLVYLKLFYRNPLVALCSDKYYAREYVKACGYETILKKIYGVYNSVDDININKLPEECFIRCTHSSGGNYVVHKSDKNWDSIKPVLRQILKHDRYYA